MMFARSVQRQPYTGTKKTPSRVRHSGRCIRPCRCLLTILESSDMKPLISLPRRLLDTVANALAKGHFEPADSGLLVPDAKIRLGGVYRDRINGGAWNYQHNLIPTEGLTSALEVAFGAGPKHAGLYIALHGGSAAPAANWTAASYASAASENISVTEGYTGATRPAWTPGAAAAGSISNHNTEASFTFASSSAVNITGAAIVTSAVRGGTTCKLISAIQWAVPRTFQNSDTYDVGYQLTASAN